MKPYTKYYLLLVALSMFLDHSLHAQEIPSKKKELEAAYMSHMTEIDNLKKEVSSLKTEISKLEADVRKLGYEKEGLIEDLNTLDHQVLELKKNEASLKAELSETKNELEINRGINTQLKSLLSSMATAQDSPDSTGTQMIVVNNASDSPYYLGSFIGASAGSVIKDENGNDMIINGQKIKTPPISHTFTFTKDQKTLLEQVNEHDQSVTQLTGTYQLTKDDPMSYEISCIVGDGKDISLNYIITIDKATKKTICSLDSQPPFELIKNTLLDNIGEITTE